MEQSPWEADNVLHGRETLAFLLQCLESRALIPNLSQTNPAQNLTHYLEDHPLSAVNITVNFKYGVEYLIFYKKKNFLNIRTCIRFAH